MKEYTRNIDLIGPASKRSVFLFGPRQTGKTYLLKRIFPDSRYYSLLQSDLFQRLSQRPWSMREELLASVKPEAGPVIIDEIQRLPLLLDEIHELIETHGFRFILTGSSARKLRRGGANLLAGRAWVRHLYPLVFPEIPDYDLVRVANVGALPPVYGSDDPVQDLGAYAGTYLREEIQAEAVVRRIDGFARFMQVAALVNAELLNFESVSRDAMVPGRTIREYFGVLEDTLVGALLKPFGRGLHRKSVATAKFYFFDVGVANSLAGRTNVNPGTELFGKCFEHVLFTELRAWLDYTQDSRPLAFWRDKNGQEVDFLIGDEIAIEAKASSAVHPMQFKGLRILSEEIRFKHRLVVSLDPQPRRIGDVDILPWREFLSRLWAGEYR